MGTDRNVYESVDDGTDRSVYESVDDGSRYRRIYESVGDMRSSLKNRRKNDRFTLALRNFDLTLGPNSFFRRFSGDNLR